MMRPGDIRDPIELLKAEADLLEERAADALADRQRHEEAAKKSGAMVEKYTAAAASYRVLAARLEGTGPASADAPTTEAGGANG